MIRRVFDVDSCGLSHAGRVRELNEDRYLVKSESGVFAVADGMGGHEAGELASSSIVEHLKSIGVPSSAPDLRARFEDRVMIANREIREISSSRNGAVIGSTLAALLAFESQYACMWAGDSRIYMLRAGALVAIVARPYRSPAIARRGRAVARGSGPLAEAQRHHAGDRRARRPAARHRPWANPSRRQVSDLQRRPDRPCVGRRNSRQAAAKAPRARLASR